MATYGAYQETEVDGKKRGRVVRSTVILDPKGNVAHHFPQVNPRGHVDQIKEKLAELQK